MFILGQTFASGVNTMDSTPLNLSNVSNLVIKNGIFDDVYITKDTSFNIDDPIPTEWDFNTILHATFDNTLVAGNTDYSVSQVEKIRIKRRKKGEFKWITLFEKEIKKVEDFNTFFYDDYARSGVEYEYGYVPVINGIEGDIIFYSILSEFDEVFIIEKDKKFKTELNMSFSCIKVNTSSTFKLMNKKYPVVLSKGDGGFYKGTMSATFVEKDESKCIYKFDSEWEYRSGFVEFALNGEPKILKHYDGRMWMIMIVDDISENESNHWQGIITTFNWNEIGDCENAKELYANNFIDIYINN
ncbi:hypothetical protein [Anaerovorax sp. IOR16]|uniref:hypothetical protein n=1 Tax=Anaerovorax sp. IOR16 TaxID=2773458 RepID=UPI0019D26560|nr:hypothetical protein [Anaerovorax sp. IOR16]